MNDILRRIAFEHNKMKFKINKMFEFYKLYKEWCMFFDKKVNELYTEKYEK